ncbi:hypothetical protein [Streptomyces aidingensis]|uniref:Uncharacterized protein n=1 Tax=Streptomyces aidingensis TaxID=910347 RepID=A0A1I1Q5P1_9ACTN|nr:hypothetical protein [Streptomyces aidingensis]SFD14533.1 hypothetical protein SAMN05421773_110123 [Streptomyces aidingensis]
MAAVTQRYSSIQYDGTNGAHIVTEWLEYADLISDDGQMLRFRSNDQDHAVPVGHWLIRTPRPRFFHESMDAADYARYWVEVGSEPA